MAEPGNDHPPTPTNNPPPETLLQLGGLPTLSFRETLVGLFLFPHLVLLSARRATTVKRPLLLFLGIWALCSLFMGLTLAPGLVTQVGEFGDWLGNEMGQLRRTNEGLAWDRPKEAPQTVRFRGFRVDFAPATAAFDLKALSSKDDWGLWIETRRVTFWTTGYKGTAKLLFDAESEKPSLNWKSFPPGSALAGDELGSRARAAARWAAPLFLIIWHGLSMFLLCALFLVLFTAMPSLLRGPQAIGGWRTSLCVNLYCGVVPLIVATVYSRVAPVTLNFLTVFVFAFLGYLIWAFSRVKRFLAGV